MTKRIYIHPTHPQARLLSQVVDCLNQGGVIAYPTDSGYALGCHLGDKNGLETIRRIRQLDKHHHFSLVCRDLSELAVYAQVSNPVFRYLKAHTPGHYTFLLAATREVPKRLLHPKKKTIGLRVPDHAVVSGLLDTLGEPIMSVSLGLVINGLPSMDPEEVAEHLDARVDIMVDAGPCPTEPTTIVDLLSGRPEVVRGQA